jgi:hypothetical protein
VRGFLVCLLLNAAFGSVVPNLFQPSTDLFTASCMHAHHRHQTRVMNLHAKDVVRYEKFTPHLVDRWAVGKESDSEAGNPPNKPILPIRGHLSLSVLRSGASWRIAACGFRRV